MDIQELRPGFLPDQLLEAFFLFKIYLTISQSILRLIFPLDQIQHGGMLPEVELISCESDKVQYLTGSIMGDILISFINLQDKVVVNYTLNANAEELFELHCNI